MSDSLTVRHTHERHADTSLPDPHQDTYSRTILGFWMYLMTDCMLFTTLFATYAVLRNSTFGGPTSSEIFDLPTTFAETMFLLFSSVTSGFAMLGALRSKKKRVIFWLAVSFILGAAFVATELSEFTHLVYEGNSWKKSAFLSAFFTLVGTHGCHVSVGLFWMAVMMWQVHYYGVTVHTFRRLVCLNMFWHFLDLVWIFIFTLVYLLGVI